MSNFCLVTDKPSIDASFSVYTSYYRNRVGLSENKLSICARLNQSYLNKIVNDKVRDVPIEVLVNISLVLHLTPEEVIDYFARCERAFSPANPIHKYYLYLIFVYSQKPKSYKYLSATALSTTLTYADDYLIAHGFPPLPNCNL